MKISEIIMDKYKLRIPPTVYYELLADVQEAEELTTNNDLGVDCISRQGTLEKFKPKGIADDVWKECHEYKVITSMPSVQPQTRWIPVSERLPEPFEFVNCTCHSLIDDREDWVVETCYLPQLPNSPYSDWGNIPMLNSCECEVIAWMYRDIPKPYKAESEDKE